MNTNQLFAGAGRADIRFPRELFPIEGFCGVHDDPAARVLLLNCGEQVAIACLELVMLPQDGIDAVKKIIGAITHTGEENIWVHVTHAITTPHAPHAPMGMGGVPLEIGEEEKKTLERKLALFNGAVMDAVTEAARGAADTLRPARMGLGTGECRVNVNRDVSTPHGWWINFAPEGPSNHTASILRFEDEKGGPIGALISYGLKPCAIDNSEMDAGSRLVSSDVPGLACRLLEERLGAPCLFAMSAAGDQVPVEQAWYDVVQDDGTVGKVDIGVQAGLEIVDRLGRQMARELGDVLEKTACGREAPSIRLDRGAIDWEDKARNRMAPSLHVEYTPRGTQRVDVEAMTLGDVALVAVKPELNTLTEAQLQAASPYAHTLVLSMVNGGMKYMPDRASYENGTWEAQSSALMPGAAEAWVDEAVRVLQRMHQKS
ncbi:MAG: hypothetical protein ACI3XJ_11510 [Oscillospiraceae bacterium]